MPLAFIFTLKICFLVFDSLTSLSPFFFSPSLFPPTLRLGTQRITQGARRRGKKKKKKRKRKEERRKAYVPLFVSKATGRRCRALASSQLHTRGVGAARCPTGTGGRLSVCQHGHWGNGVKQISLSCAPMSAFCVGLPLWLPSPRLRLPGDWRQASRQAGEKHVSGSLSCQPKGRDTFKTTQLEINDFLLPWLQPGHAGRGTGLSLQEREDAFDNYKFY